MWSVFYCWRLLSRNSSGSILRLGLIHPFHKYLIKSYCLPFWDATGNVTKSLPSWILYSSKETDHKHLTTQIYSTTWEVLRRNKEQGRAMENNRQGSLETNQGCLDRWLLSRDLKWGNILGRRNSKWKGPEEDPCLGSPENIKETRIARCLFLVKDLSFDSFLYFISVFPPSSLKYIVNSSTLPKYIVNSSTFPKHIMNSSTSSLSVPTLTQAPTICSCLDYCKSLPTGPL